MSPQHRKALPGPEITEIKGLSSEMAPVVLGLNLDASVKLKATHKDQTI